MQLHFLAQFCKLPLYRTVNTQFLGNTVWDGVIYGSFLCDTNNIIGGATYTAQCDLPIILYNTEMYGLVC